jgi:hypothetical protein
LERCMSQSSRSELLINMRNSSRKKLMWVLFLSVSSVWVSHFVGILLDWYLDISDSLQL